MRPLCGNFSGKLLFGDVPHPDVIELWTNFHKADLSEGYKRIEMSRVVLITFAFMALLSPPLLAGDAAKPKFSNIGFVKDPPKELSDRFPMCDAFLKVEWIDKDKKIGYSHYEAVIEDEQKSVWALVNLDDLMPSYTLDIYQYKRHNKMNELFKLVKSGKSGRSPHDLFEIGGQVFEENFLAPLLSDNQQTVCLVYPDQQRAWVIEGKSPEHAFNETQINELLAKLNEFEMPGFTPEYAAAHNLGLTRTLFTQEIVNPYWVLDINYDGKADLMTPYGVRTVIFSFGNRYYEMATKDSLPSYYIDWSVPPHQKICELKPYGNITFLTTDGKNYFFNNQCNLTELTSGSEKQQ